MLKIYVDGASRGNPGDAAYAFILMDEDDEILKQESAYIGTNTNNVAEYTAIINALKAAKKHTDGDILLFSDSQLAVRQLNGQYRIKATHLAKLAENVFTLRDQFKSVKFTHVKRNTPGIQKCDALCNKELDRTS